MSKSAAIPKTLVEPARRALYEKALQARQKVNPDGGISVMVREAMDRLAAKDLGMSLSEFRAKVQTLQSRTG